MDTPPNFRIPGDPDQIAALGRAMWNCLYIEGMAVAVLHDAGASSLGDARTVMASGKEKLMRELRERLDAEGAPDSVKTALDQAIDAYKTVRLEQRNILAHAHHHATGLGYADSEGRHRTISESSSDLFAIAREVEKAIDPLSRARTALAEYQEARASSSP
jgi:hypothetical protein